MDLYLILLLNSLNNEKLNNVRKLFITHSDVSWSNNYIKKYYNVLDTIITVNNYTKKIEYFLKLNNSNKIKKIINYLI